MTCNDYSHFPTADIDDTELCPFLLRIIRAGGGRIARRHVGGHDSDVVCLVENTLYPHVLHLHWHEATKGFVPAILASHFTIAIVTMARLQEYLPVLLQAYQQAINHPANRQRKAA